MAYNNYIVSLLALEKEIGYRINNEIEECLRGRGNSARLKESLEYIIETSGVLSGCYKEDEQMK